MGDGLGEETPEEMAAQILRDVRAPLAVANKQEAVIEADHGAKSTQEEAGEAPRNVNPKEPTAVESKMQLKPASAPTATQTATVTSLPQVPDHPKGKGAAGELQVVWLVIQQPLIR